MRMPPDKLFLVPCAAAALIALCAGCDQSPATTGATKPTPAAGRPAPTGSEAAPAKAPGGASPTAATPPGPAAATPTPTAPLTPPPTPTPPTTATPTPTKLVTAVKGDAAKGKRIWAAFGCATCHAIEGKNPQGPTMKGYWMTARKLSDGREVIADVEYTRRAILEPAAEIVPGYPIPMTSFKGMLDDDQVNDLIAYLKSLGN